VAGDFTGLSDVQRGLRLNRQFLARPVQRRRRRRGAAGRARPAGGELDNAGPELLAVISNGRSSELSLRLSDAPDRLDAAVSALNTRLGGQSLFAGDAPDQPALADASRRSSPRCGRSRPARRHRDRHRRHRCMVSGRRWRFETVGYLGRRHRETLSRRGHLTQPGIGARNPASERRCPVSPWPRSPRKAAFLRPTAHRRDGRGGGGADDEWRSGGSWTSARASACREGRIEEARVRAEATRTACSLKRRG
jgi:hypothetical protein